MAITFTLQYHDAVIRDDIPRLAKTWRARVQSAIEEKLTTHPDVYGKPLRRSLKGYRKLRVGDYRVVFRISGVHVKIFAIEHRSVVYEVVEARV